MSKRRQKRAQLRALECLAYSSTLSYLRLENSCEQESKYIIENLRNYLHISSHRHLSELKRIINDEELERLNSLKYFGENNSKHKWIELEEQQEEDIKTNNNNNSIIIKKKFKGT